MASLSLFGGYVPFTALPSGPSQSSQVRMKPLTTMDASKVICAYSWAAGAHAPGESGSSLSKKFDGKRSESGRFT